MRKCIEHREFIPAAEVPAEMPEGIAVKYYIRGFGDFQAITKDNVNRILKNLRSGKWESIYLYHEDDEEGDCMQLESGGGLYNLGYLKDLGSEWWSTYDPDFLGSDEETGIRCSDGQSIIFRETTTADKEAVMRAIEYFIRTGELWNGIPWMHDWQEWVEE